MQGLIAMIYAHLFIVYDLTNLGTFWLKSADQRDS